MGWIIYKQPPERDSKEALYALWSTIVDAFLCEDATYDQIEDIYRAHALREADKQARRSIVGARPQSEYELLKGKKSGVMKDDA